MKVAIEDHLKLFAPLSPRQWGFISSRSTISALVKVVEDWCKAVDSNHEVAIVFFYVQKAFDTVPHINLLKHLQALNK